VYRIVLYCLA